MLVFYHIIVSVAFLAVSPFILLRMVFDSVFRYDILRRVGGKAEAPQTSGCIWVHAASAGEMRVAKILWRALKKECPSRPLALSTFTATGYELAKKEGLNPIFRLPPDSPFWMGPLLKKLDPAMLVLVEAELWPCLLGTCKDRGIPILLINGRMSLKAFRRYEKFKQVFRILINPISFFSMRAEVDSRRVLSLGIAQEKVRVTGNIKFDTLTSDITSDGGVFLGKDSGMIVFGSTRPGDEGPIMEAVIRLRQDVPKLQCVLAPRHIERCEELEGLIRDYELRFIRHSKIHKGSIEQPPIILLDTIGDLNLYYRKSCIAFVGGGFNPRFGGHNILEPAVYRQPVVYGKHMTNFEEEAILLADSGGGIQIDSPEELYPTLLRLLKNPEERARRGKFAENMVKNNGGAVQRNLDLIKSFL